jgi:DNA modification methylase
VLHRLHTTDGLRDYGTATWEGGDPECDHKKPAGGGHGELSPIGKGERDIEIMTSQRYFNVCRKCGAVRTDNQIGLESTPEAYVDKLVAVFREVRRVLRNDGVLWLNLGDSYAASGKSRGNSGSGPSSVKQKTSPGSYFHSELNGKCPDGLKPKDLIGIPWRVAFALQADGWWLRQDIIWSKPNPMPESVTDRCTKAHEYIFLLTKSARYYYDQEAVKEPCQWSESWSASNTHTAVAQGGKHGKTSIFNQRWADKNGGRNRRSVWTITTKPFFGAHFAVFPPEIPEICIKAGSKPGDTILDPFSGAGTTGNVAERLGRKYIGIELNPAYSEIGEKRIDAARLPLAEQWG